MLKNAEGFMNYFDFITVPIIVSVVYGGLALLKKATGENEKVLRFLPLIAAGLGAVLGIIAFFAMPELIPASNAFVAVLIGGASGLAATGTNQIIKQLGKFLGEDKEDGGNGNDGGTNGGAEK
jgi:peptidoglycan/LPS O-acetylase OafA/YrhL